MLQTIHESIGSPLAFGLAGHWEIVIIVVVVLLLFGGKKLPELARGVARGLHIFKSETRADECIQELITRNNMTPDPDPEDGHEEACDTDPQCVAYKACGLAATSKIWKLVL